MASASVSTETHAPFSIKLSADAAWRESSLVIRRTRTFVSTARMTLSDVTPDALSQFFEASGRRRPGPEHRPMDILGTEAARTTDDNVVAIRLPFRSGERW